MNEVQVFTRAEAARLLKISIRTLDRYICSDALKVIRIGRGVRIPLSSIQEFIDQMAA